MSVRRLAQDSVQPAHFAFAGDNVAWAELTIDKYPEGRQQSAVIPLLMRAQEQDGWVTKAAIEHIAGMLKMPLIRVLEVATFYTQFQLKPVGTRAHIQVCGTTPCMLRGSDELKRVCQSKIHHEQFHLNAAGTLSWEEVECLGACVNAPMVMVFKDTYEDLTPERLTEIIDLFESGQGGDVPVGPQNGRHQSVPIGGLTTLKSESEGAAELVEGNAERIEPSTTAPSQPGRFVTNAAETDPSLSVPGKAVNANADQAVESQKSIDPADGASATGAGSAGGSVEGPTGAGEKEASGPGPGGASAGFSSVPSETGRITDDVVAGPGATDHIEPSSAEATGATAPEVLVSPGERPEGLLLAGPSGVADDLKLIRGVGPVLEAKMHDLGVYHFRQIAAWTPAELLWIDNHLNFRGRAIRERWIDQARELAASVGKSE